jgi:hypothetical protein
LAWGKIYMHRMLIEKLEADVMIIFRWTSEKYADWEVD